MFIGRVPLPTHPRAFVRFGRTKGEIRVKKGHFRGDLGGLRGLDLVWESATPPTHIWEKSPKQNIFVFFFLFFLGGGGFPHLSWSAKKKLYIYWENLVLLATGQHRKGLGGVITGEDEHHCDISQNIFVPSVYLPPLAVQCSECDNIKKCFERRTWRDVSLTYTMWACIYQGISREYWKCKSLEDPSRWNISGEFTEIFEDSANH